MLSTGKLQLEMQNKYVLAQGQAKLAQVQNKDQKTLLLPSASYQPQYFYECLIARDSTWHKARILAIRLSAGYISSAQRTADSYQYYVHYEQMDRRNDAWVAANHIRQLAIPQKISKISKEPGDALAQFRVMGQFYTQSQNMSLFEVNMHQKLTLIKGIQRVMIGEMETKAWYSSPYPAKYQNISCLFICQFCLKYFKHSLELAQHKKSCLQSRSPGNEIYRDNNQNIAVFQVNSRYEPNYCHRLCLLGKLFIDHKIVKQSSQIFIFYVLCELVKGKYRIAGYFSKLRNSQLNLSCLVVLPFHRRKGYGKFLISLSYHFTLLQNKTGSPEKPLSDMGRKVYLAWWSQRLVLYLKAIKGKSVSINDVCTMTGMIKRDVLWTLETVGLLKVKEDKMHLLLEDKQLDAVYLAGGKQGLPVDLSLLHWEPLN